MVEVGIFDQADQSDDDLSDHVRNRIHYVTCADEAGVAGYHLAEHHGSLLSLIPSQSAFLAAAAMATRHIKLGSMIKVAAFHHPIRLIEDFCILDAVSSGRAMLGIGNGGTPREKAWFGVTKSPEEMIELTSETITAVSLGLHSKELTFVGNHIKIEKFPLVVTPYKGRRVRMWRAAGRVENVVDAALSDSHLILGFMPTNVLTPLATIARSAAKTNPFGSDRRLGTTRYLVLSRDPRRANNAAARAYRKSRQSNDHLQRFRNNASHPSKVAKQLPASYDILQDHGLGYAGDAEGFISFLRRQAGATGLNYFILQMIFGDLQEEEVTESIEELGSVMDEIKAI